MVRSIQRRQPRRNTQRAWLLGAVGVGVVIAVLGVGSRPDSQRDAERQAADGHRHRPTGSIATRPEGEGVCGDRPEHAGEHGPPDTTVQRASHHEGSPAPTAPEKSPAVAPAHPRAGGELTFVVPGEPPSYDAHREETFALIHPAAPHYNTLLRIDPLDPTGTRVVGDLATSWTVSPDKRTYVLKLRRGVKFHDGSEMTSRDVRATYEKIINPLRGSRRPARGRVPPDRDRPGAGTVHRRVQAQVAIALVHPFAGVAVELDLQGRHPRARCPLVREEHHGHGAVRLRRARQGLALGRPTEPGVLGPRQAISRRLPGALHP